MKIPLNLINTSDSGGFLWNGDGSVIGIFTISWGLICGLVYGYEDRYGYEGRYGYEDRYVYEDRYGKTIDIMDVESRIKKRSKASTSAPFLSR
ncbi:MAG: hypothetical protein K2J03_04350 [Muribaculaceae bacterium]|nr:hypothetical protein [Muribaculaceae bacterium]